MARRLGRVSGARLADTDVDLAAPPAAARLPDMDVDLAAPPAAARLADMDVDLAAPPAAARLPETDVDLAAPPAAADRPEPATSTPSTLPSAGVLGHAEPAEPPVGRAHGRPRRVGAPRPRLLPVAWIAAAVAVALLLSVAWVRAGTHPRSPSRSSPAVVAAGSRTATPPRPPVPPACPRVDRGCRPIDDRGGIVVDSARFDIGGPEDQVVLGRWDCTGDAFPAVLRPATGELWVFDQWAMPGRPVTGRLLGDVPGASAVQVVPGRDGCDTLSVARLETHATTFNPRLP